jgi:DNA-binding NtrC family response regulator
MASNRILVVDDDEPMLQILGGALRTLPDMEVLLEPSSRQAAERLSREPLDLLITDVAMPDMDGVELARRARAIDATMAILMVTGYPTLETAVQCLKLGVNDYLTKPCQATEFLAKVQSVLAGKQVRDEHRLLRRQMEKSYCCGTILGKSAAMEKVCERIQRAAETDFDVLIIGETGTGKELVAHALHRRSRRKDGPFVPINCGAIPDELLESELFGHERGAFTGAQTRSLGLFEYAQNGTFFLDELNQLPPRLQGKLLRVVQERTIRRVGGSKEIPINVRLVAASSMSLEEAVRREQFRADLYHRINVARIELPPLRQRTEDIPLLVEAFVGRYAQDLQRGPVQMSAEAMEVLCSYSWPGNVRELQNALKRALTFARGNLILVEDLSDEIVAHAGDATLKGTSGFFELRERKITGFEKEYFEVLLRRHAGDVTAAAGEAQLPRGTLYRLIKKYGFDPTDFRSANAPASALGAGVR